MADHVSCPDSVRNSSNFLSSYPGRLTKREREERDCRALEDEARARKQAEAPAPAELPDYFATGNPRAARIRDAVAESRRCRIAALSRWLTEGGYVAQVAAEVVYATPGIVWG